jgi:beta-ribofuranosylaminobenzene 5'-phosphate synthase
VRRFSDAFGVEPRVSIRVTERIPEHVGLGSGTQLALALGAGLAAVCGIDADTRELARILRRGKRSGIGVAAFGAGGFIVDAGVRTSETSGVEVPTVVWRYDVPSDWCFVVAVPNAGEGLSGHREEGVFATLTPSIHISEEVCRLTQLRLMPSLVEGDIDAFGSAITVIDRKSGSYFSDVQGGLYSHKETNETVAAMLELGALGAGQSSWGPAVYGVVRERNAGKLEAELRRFFALNGLGDTVYVCRGRNTRARVEVRRDEL